MASSERDASPCPECGGSGWILGEEPHGAVRRCACRRQRDASRLLREAGIPVRYQNCRLSTFQVSHPAAAGRDELVRALSLCRRYVEGFLAEEEGVRFRDTGLLFSGPPGAGKTHLAVAVLVELIERFRVRGRFADFTSLTQELHSAMDPDSSLSRTAILAPVEQAEVLVLDELGSQKLGAWTADVLYHLVNRRYARKLPTIFTTNYRLEEVNGRPESLDRGADVSRFSLLSYRIPAMLTSRLYEMALPIDLHSVSDYRRDVRSHQHHG